MRTHGSETRSEGWRPGQALATPGAGTRDGLSQRAGLRVTLGGAQAGAEQAGRAGQQAGGAQPAALGKAPDLSGFVVTCSVRPEVGVPVAPILQERNWGTESQLGSEVTELAGLACPHPGVPDSDTWPHAGGEGSGPTR